MAVTNNGSRRIQIRIPLDQLAEIDRAAKAAGITRTRMLLDNALGNEHIFKDHEDRITRLEQLTYGH